MLAKVTAIQFFPLLLLFFLSLFYFYPIAPALDSFYKYQLYQLLSRKRATPLQDGSSYLFGRQHIHSRAHSSLGQGGKKKNNNPKQKRLSLVTSSCVTSPVKESMATVAADPLSIFVLPKSTDSPILQISKSFKSRTVWSKELARRFEIFSDRRGNEAGFALRMEKR